MVYVNVKYHRFTPSDFKGTGIIKIVVVIFAQLLSEDIRVKL